MLNNNVNTFFRLIQNGATTLLPTTEHLQHQVQQEATGEDSR